LAGYLCLKKEETGEAEVGAESLSLQTAAGSEGRKGLKGLPAEAVQCAGIAWAIGLFTLNQATPKKEEKMRDFELTKNRVLDKAAGSSGWRDAAEGQGI